MDNTGVDTDPSCCHQGLGEEAAAADFKVILKQIPEPAWLSDFEHITWRQSCFNHLKFSMFQIQSKNKIDQNRTLSKLSFILLIFRFAVSYSYLIKIQCLYKCLLEMSHILYLFSLLECRYPAQVVAPSCFVLWRCLSSRHCLWKKFTPVHSTGRLQCTPSTLAVPVCWTA